MKKFLHDVPDILYKYRDWQDPYHKRLLTDRELYFASVDQFNDPFDGTIPYKYDPVELTEDNIFRKYYLMTKRDHPDWEDVKIHAECFEYQRRGYFHDEKHLEDFEREALDDVKRQFGIVCLCRRPDNFLLWSHYSKSHTGICIGFNKVLLFEDAHAQFAHMQYQEKLPMLGLFDNVFTHFAKLIGTKSNIWEYEDEYRLTRAEFARGKQVLRKETIEEVILGCRMPQSERQSIVEFLSAEFPHARVYEMVLSKTDFKIERMQIR